MISVQPAGWACRCVKYFNIAIFSDTIEVVIVTLCMMIPLTELYPFIPFSASLGVFRGHIWLYLKVTTVSNSFNWKFYVCIG